MANVTNASESCVAWPTRTRLSGSVESYAEGVTGIELA